MAHTTRRRFLKSTVAASAAFSTFTVAGTKSSGNVLRANDAIRIGVCGLNSRGGAHINAFAGMKGVQVTYVVDPDAKLHESRLKQVESRGGNKAQAVQDVRVALDDKELDAVSVATPNHWHSLIGIWACQAGKDAFIEKPGTQTVHEGRILTDLALKNKCIVQHGTQRRSGGTVNLARDIAAGKKGKLLISKSAIVRRRNSIGFKKPESPPDSLDFNLWLGPAPEQPFHRNLVHYNWHWFWDFGSGEIGNNGIHCMDLARWIIPNGTLPKSVISVGGRFGYADQAETANTQLAVYDYGETLLVCEIRNLPTGGLPFTSQVFDSSASVEPVEVKTVPGVKNPLADRGPGGDIFSNFISSVRSRNSEDLDAHMLEGHYSSALCHLANISYRLGEKLPFNKKTNALGDNKEVVELLEKLRDHLKDNNIKLDETEYVVGRKLRLDAETENIIGDEEANRLLTRQYRAPFVVPEKVA